LSIADEWLAASRRPGQFNLMIFFRDPGVCRLYPKKEDNQANEGDGGQQSSSVEWAVGC